MKNKLEFNNLTLKKYFFSELTPHDYKEKKENLEFEFILIYF